MNILSGPGRGGIQTSGHTRQPNSLASLQTDILEGRRGIGKTGFIFKVPLGAARYFSDYLQ